MLSSLFSGAVQAMAASGLALTGGAVTYTTANTVPFVINGKFFSKAAIGATAAPTVDAKVTAFNQTANLNANSGLLVLQPQQGAAALWCLDKGGNVLVLFSNVVPLDGAAAGSGNFLVAPNLSELMASLPISSVDAFGYPQDVNSVGAGNADLICPFAYSVHKNQNASSGTTTWQFGVNNWNAANIVSTVQDINTVPNRPQVA